MAPRSIWKGSITFGLITIPIKIFTAVGREAEEKIDMHLLHEKDGERIHYERTCDKGHKNIEWDEIVKGYEYQKGKWVEITDEDLEALDLESLHTIDVDSFVLYEHIDPVYFDKTYYVVPEEAGVKAYRLLVEALEDEGLVGVAKVAIRERERLCTLRVSDNYIVMETMHWPEELREADFDEFRKRPRVEDRERKMARQLIQQLSGDFDPGRYKDDYHKELKKLIRKKVKGQDILIPEAAEEPEAGVIDLMEALRESIDSAGRGGKRKSSRSGSRRRSSGKAAGDNLSSMSKEELAERAKKLDISGRSKMDKQQLMRAIKKAS